MAFRHNFECQLRIQLKIISWILYPVKAAGTEIQSQPRGTWDAHWRRWDGAGVDCVPHVWELFGVAFATGKLHTHRYTLAGCTCCGENSILITVTITNVICATEETVAGCTAVHGLPHWWISRCHWSWLRMHCSSLPYTTYRLPLPLLPAITCSAGRTGLPGSAWTVVKAILVAFQTLLQNIYLFALCLCFVCV